MPNEYQVNCHRCHANVYDSGSDGGDPPTDAQALLTEYADKSCLDEKCPHKTSARQTQDKSRPATLADLEALKGRLTSLEAKVK